MVDSIGKIREPERELEVFEDRQRRRYVRGMVLTRLIAAAIVADISATLCVSKITNPNGSVIFSISFSINNGFR